MHTYIHPYITVQPEVMPSIGSLGEEMGMTDYCHVSWRSSSPDCVHLSFISRDILRLKTKRVNDLPRIDKLQSQADKYMPT
jgi:hypothetical protein